MNTIVEKVDKYFSITERGSSIRKEIIGGVTAFLSMSFIIFVNPSVLGDAGMNPSAVFASTLLGASIATLIMGVFAKFPLGLASCMSMNAFFAYSVVNDSGFSWQEALACVLLSSILFIGLSASGMRQKFLKAMPKQLKSAGSVGLGLYIFFMGLRNSEIIVIDQVQIVKLGSFTNPNVIIAATGIIALVVLLVRKSKYAVVYSMMWALIMGVGISILNSNGILNIDAETASRLPYVNLSNLQLPHVPIMAMIDETLFVAVENIPKVLSVSGIGVILTFTFLDFLGTTETLTAASSELEHFDIKTDNKGIYMVDAIGTFFGSLLGTSNITTYTESVSGVVAGARTGLAAVVVAILFLLSFFLYPFLSLFTTPITAPALIAIGIFMFKNVADINWKADFEVTIPAFFTIALMPMTGSIALGLTFGFIFHTLLMLVAGRRKEVHPYLYFLNAISLLYIATKAF